MYRDTRYSLDSREENSLFLWIPVTNVPNLTSSNGILKMCLYYMTKDNSKILHSSLLLLSIFFPHISTGCAKLIFTLCKIAVILAVSTLQKRVIRLWNGNFVGFLGIFSKFVKNVPMKRYFHFSGKWQNRPTRIWNLTLKFEAIRGQYGLKPLLIVYFNSIIVL